MEPVWKGQKKELRPDGNISDYFSDRFGCEQAIFIAAQYMLDVLFGRIDGLFDLEL